MKYVLILFMLIFGSLVSNAQSLNRQNTLFYVDFLHNKYPAMFDAMIAIEGPIEELKQKSTEELDIILSIFPKLHELQTGIHNKNYSKTHNSLLKYGTCSYLLFEHHTARYQLMKTALMNNQCQYRKEININPLTEICNSVIHENPNIGSIDPTDAYWICGVYTQDLTKYAQESGLNIFDEFEKLKELYPVFNENYDQSILENSDEATNFKRWTLALIHGYDLNIIENAKHFTLHTSAYLSKFDYDYYDFISVEHNRSSAFLEDLRLNY